jgi:hypothetical protein
MIYCLVVNDFSMENRQLMLENLPAYVVKDVRVYDKEGDLSAIKGRDVDAKRYVMDVKT